MKITTLAENLTYQRGLIAEHGLSLFIEINDKKILFDTGQGHALVHNARVLGFDLGDIDDIVISHGHYDHTGGLEALLDLNDRALVYLKEEAFSDKQKGTQLSGKQKNIGINSSDIKISDRSRLLHEPLEIEKDVFVMTDIPIKNTADKGFSGFITAAEEGYKQDEFEDELYLAVLHNRKMSIFSGCSHRGISNILVAAGYYFSLPINLVIGGFHLKECTEEQYKTVAESLNQHNPESIGVCHCTGIDAYCRLQKDCGERVFYNSCGNRIEVE